MWAGRVGGLQYSTQKNDTVVSIKGKAVKMKLLSRIFALISSHKHVDGVSLPNTPAAQVLHLVLVFLHLHGVGM